MVLCQVTDLHMLRPLQHHRRRRRLRRITLLRLTGLVLITMAGHHPLRHLHPQPPAAVFLHPLHQHGDLASRKLYIESQHRRKSRCHRRPVSMLLLRYRMPVNTLMSNLLLALHLGQLPPRDHRRRPSKNKRRSLQGADLVCRLPLLARG